MKAFLLEILADPITGSPLTPGNDDQVITKSGDRKYNLVGEIPNFVNDISEAGENIATGSELPAFDYRSHYEKDAEVFDYSKADEHLVTRNERKRTRESVIQAVPKTANIILDIGCGGAWVANHFLSKGKKVISMDISTTNPAKALSAYPHPNHAAVIADAFHLPFKDESIDCIIAAEVIEHVYDPKLFIANIFKKIKTGGKLILLTPYNETIEYFLCIHCNKPTPKSAHLHSFDEKKIKDIIPLHGNALTTTSFCNKYLLKLRLYNLLSFLPFTVWRVIDKMGTLLINKPLHFMIEITKTAEFEVSK